MSLKTYLLSAGYAGDETEAFDAALDGARTEPQLGRLQE